MVKIAALTSPAKAAGTPGRFLRPQSLAAAAELMRRRLDAQYPTLARLGKWLANSGFAFSVNNGSDFLVYKVARPKALAEIVTLATAFAGQNGFRLGSDQTEANIISQSIIADPIKFRLGDEIHIRVIGRPTGDLGIAKNIITSLSSRQLAAMFSHHLLDDLIFSPLDCLARATADLGIAREDLKLAWTDPDQSVRNLRRGVFFHDQELADEVPAAETLLAGERNFSPDVLKLLNDIRLKVIERVTPENLLLWNLSGHCKSKFVPSAIEARQAAFRFITDPIFDPREPIYRRCRERTFERHPEGAFLADVYRRMTSPGYADVPAADIEQARQIIEGVKSQELERMLISHHWTDHLEPATTPIDMYCAAFSLFGVKRARPTMTPHLELGPHVSEIQSERRIIEKTIRMILRHHPQSKYLSEMFVRLNRQEPIDGPDRLKLRSLLKELPIEAMKKWGVELPAWLEEGTSNADDLFVIVFPALESK